MSNDHHNNGHNENKPVAFTAPLILGSITVFIILLFVSLGNPCHGCCEGKEECAKECTEKGGKEHGGHEEGHAAATHEEHATENAAAETTTATDSTHQEEPVKKEEAHH